MGGAGNRTEPTYDAVVVGARAAGAATAYLLAREGLQVLLLDRSRYGSDTLSTHALMRGGVLQLSRWGLLDKLVEAGTPPVRRVTFRCYNEVVPLTIKPWLGVDALYAPRRTVLDPLLVDAAVAAGADVRFGVAVGDVLRDGSGTVTGVVGRSRDGRALRACGRIVIGADGIRSTIAQGVGARVERAGTARAAAVYGYWSGLATDGYEWNFRPDAASGVIPTNDGLTCVYASGTPRRVGRGGLATLTDIIAESSPELAGRLAGATAPTSVRNFVGHVGYLRRCWGPGWALVGDAGYYKDPLSAHGLTDALRDAELLARAVTSSGSPSSLLDALAGYQDTRDRLSVRLFDAVDAVASHQWTAAEISGLLQEMSSSMDAEVKTLAGLDEAAMA